jgi:hypothetical protein
MASTTLKIDRGTLFTFTYTYKKSGVPTSLVGATVRFTMKASEFSANTTDSDALIIKDVTDGASDGTCQFAITPTDTATITKGTYNYDIKVDELSDGTIVYKTVEGKIKLDASPTNRLS